MRIINDNDRNYQKKKKLKTNIYYVNVNLSGDMLKCHENVDAMQKK